MMNRRK